MTAPVPAREPTRLLTPDHILLIDGEPRICDVRLGGALGFLHARKIRELIERNLAEIETYGAAPRRGALQARGDRGGTQEVAEYWLSESQALLVCMFARTARAAEVRKALIAAFLAYRAGKALPAPLPEKPFALSLAQRINVASYAATMIGKGDRDAYDRALEFVFRSLGGET